LGFTYAEADGNYHVVVPTRRIDVLPRVADLAEEIGRLHGYDNIVGALPVLEGKKGEYKGTIKTRKLLSKRLRALGLTESRTYTLINEDENKLFNYSRGESIYLLRPMSSDKTIIRQSILSSLLKVYEYNKTRNVKDINIYEISNI
jgi:phenylalanyl-tRNA synthetase beta chain